MKNRLSPTFIAAGAVVALSIFILFSMLFYGPEDYLNHSEQMAEADGLRFHVASVFFGSFGVGAYVGIAIVLAWAVIVFFRETVGDLALRAVSLAVVAVSGAALFDLLGSNQLGGSLGFAIGNAIHATIGGTLGAILMIAVFGTSVVLATDFGFLAYVREAREALAVEIDEPDEESPATDLLTRIEQTAREVEAEEPARSVAPLATDDEETDGPAAAAVEDTSEDRIVITLRPPIEEETLDEDLLTSSSTPESVESERDELDDRPQELLVAPSTDDLAVPEAREPDEPMTEATIETATEETTEETAEDTVELETEAETRAEFARIEDKLAAEGGEPVKAAVEPAVESAELAEAVAVMESLAEAELGAGPAERIEDVVEALVGVRTELYTEVPTTAAADVAAEEAVTEEIAVEIEEAVEAETAVEDRTAAQTEELVEAEEAVEIEEPVEAETAAEDRTAAPTEELVEAEEAVETEEPVEAETAAEDRTAAPTEELIEAEAVEIEEPSETETAAEEEIAAPTEELIEAEAVEIEEPSETETAAEDRIVAPTEELVETEAAIEEDDEAAVETILTVTIAPEIETEPVAEVDRGEPSPAAEAPRGAYVATTDTGDLVSTDEEFIVNRGPVELDDEISVDVEVEDPEEETAEPEVVETEEETVVADEETQGRYDTYATIDTGDLVGTDEEIFVSRGPIEFDDGIPVSEDEEDEAEEDRTVAAVEVEAAEAGPPLPFASEPAEVAAGTRAAVAPPAPASGLDSVFDTLLGPAPVTAGADVEPAEAEESAAEVPVLQDLFEKKTPERSGVIATLFGKKKAKKEPAGLNDPLLDESAALAIERGRASVVLLQRRLDIGYTRASRLIEALEHRGMVGPLLESGSRDVLMTLEEWERRQR